MFCDAPFSDLPLSDVTVADVSATTTIAGNQATGQVGTVVAGIGGLSSALTGTVASGLVGTILPSGGDTGSVGDDGAIIVKIAPFLPVDTITTAGYQLYHYVDDVLTADGPHTTTGIDAIPNVTNGYCVGLTDEKMTLDSNGGYSGIIVWDSGGGSPFYRDDEVYIPAVSSGDAIWSEIIEGSYSAKDLLRILVAVAAGKTVIVRLGKNHGMVTYRNVTDTGDMIEAEMQSSERVVVTITP